MNTEVRHEESWHVTVRREDGDGWPDKVLISGLLTRYMRPETVTFRLNAGEEHPNSVQVFGSKIDSDSVPVGCRYHLFRKPEWLAAIIEDARQEQHLTPDVITGKWTAVHSGE